MTIWNVLFLFYSIAKIMIFQNKKENFPHMSLVKQRNSPASNSHNWFNK